MAAFSHDLCPTAPLTSLEQAMHPWPGLHIFRLALCVFCTAYLLVASKVVSDLFGCGWQEQQKQRGEAQEVRLVSLSVSPYVQSVAMRRCGREKRAWIKCILPGTLHVCAYCVFASSSCLTCSAVSWISWFYRATHVIFVGVIVLIENHHDTVHASNKVHAFYLAHAFIMYAECCFLVCLCVFGFCYSACPLCECFKVITFLR